MEMSGRFEFYKDQADEFRFRLIAGDGDIVLASEGYKSKRGCMKGIESVRINSSNPDNYVMEPTINGVHRFKLVSLNGRVIGISQDFESAAAYNSGLTSVAKLASDASIDDQT